jgi:putative spermidine/putrescine transport system substrate-binding protein
MKLEGMRSLLTSSWILVLACVLAGCHPRAQDEALTTEELARRAASEDGTVLSYGMPDSWGGYRGLFEAFEDQYGIRRYDINMSSSDALRRLREERDDPVVDVAVVGYLYGPTAAEQGLLDCVPTPLAAELPELATGPRDSDCRGWFATYTGTLGFLVNREVVQEPPRSWADLRREDLRGKVAFVDPRASATGVATLVAASLAGGGDIKNTDPGVDILVDIARTGGTDRVLPGQDYDPFVRGTVPILINYDYNCVLIQDKYSIDAEFVLPEDGTVSMPYSTLLVRDRPHPYTARLLIDFMLSLEGQARMADGHVRPIRSTSRQVPDPRLFEVDWTEVADSVEGMKSAFGRAMDDMSREPR